MVQDVRGNILGAFDPESGSVTWNDTRVTGYGSIAGHRPLSLDEGAPLWAAASWRGKYPELSGLYWLGMRYYDPVAGRFLTADPLGHNADPSLYSAFNGDPINYFDADGRFGKQIIHNLGENQYRMAQTEAAITKYRSERIAGDYSRGGGGVTGTTTVLNAYNPVVPFFNLAAQTDIYALDGRSFDGYDNSENIGLAGLTIIPFAWEYRGLIGESRVATMTTRERVLANIAETRRGTQSSRFENYAAKEAQIKQSVQPSKPIHQIVVNGGVGEEWDTYVKETKLRLLDEAGQLGTQEKLPTPDLLPDKSYIRPDYTIYNSRGGIAAYADAKSGVIPFDSQAQGLVLWSTTTDSKVLVYYVPRSTAISPSLVNFARQNGVKIRVIVVK